MACPITGGAGPMLAGSGRLTGLVAVRDGVAVTYQNQLDEIARGLIQAFAESDQSATPTLPDVPGLFTYAGAPAMPPAGSVLTGLAGTIKVNASVDPAQGGNAARLRDGGISGNPAYRLQRVGRQRLIRSGWSSCWTGSTRSEAFDAAAQAAPSGTVAGFAASSVAWLQEARKSADADDDYKTALQGPGVGGALQGHRRQPRRGDDAAAGAGALLPGLDEAGLDHRQHAGRPAAGGGVKP